MPQHYRFIAGISCAEHAESGTIGGFLLIFARFGRSRLGFALVAAFWSKQGARRRVAGGRSMGEVIPAHAAAFSWCRDYVLWQESATLPASLRSGRHRLDTTAAAKAAGASWVDIGPKVIFGGRGEKEPQ